MRDPHHTAVGTWSGGRYLHFGEAIDEDRLAALLRPGAGIDTVLTADAYGSGDADRVLSTALTGIPRADYCLVGAVGHDFYEGEREGAKGFPRFTDARLRGPDGYADYLRMAVEKHLERIGVDALDVLLLHNPDRIGYSSPVVWDALAALRDDGLCGALGVAPGPANGFTLDILACLERFGDLIDWAMVILNPFEPWPGELCLEAARAHGIGVITRVVDYGGLFWDDVRPGHQFGPKDHRTFRPAGWVEAGAARLEQLRPYAEKHSLTPLQLAAQWNLAHRPVSCVVPTLIQEAGDGARPIEDKRAELAAVPAERLLQDGEVDAIRAIGDNTGCMALKGANPDHEGDERPDRWGVGPDEVAAGIRWGIDPDRDLRTTMSAAS